MSKCPNIAACFSKEFTGFPNTICELIQGNYVKVRDARRRHVEHAVTLIIV